VSFSLTGRHPFNTGSLLDSWADRSEAGVPRTIDSPLRPKPIPQSPPVEGCGVRYPARPIMPDDIPERPGTEDSMGIADQLREMVGSSKTSRSQDDECDHCGASEGSVITSKEDNWSLCRECYNDPEVLSEYVD